MSEPLSTMERLALKSQHEGHNPHDARVLMVEEMAAAASSLRTQAGELVNTVSVFRTGSGDGSASPRLLAH